MASKIAYQGEPGANSHIACLKNYPKFDSVACDTFEDVFQMVEDGEVEIAMIPIENTIAGRVADIHHLLPQTKLTIIGEYFLKVKHNLLAIKGASINDLKKVQSHIHALGQCRKVINELKLKPVIGGDTAGSAREINQRNDKNCAAIATELAARIYDLKILRKNIQDNDNNITRFIILNRHGNDLPATGNGVITAFIFVVRNIPSALFKALGGFATNSVNMIKLESYQIGGNFMATQFYAEIIGHPDSKAVKRSFDELDFFCARWRILGTFRANRSRRKL